MNGAHEAPHRKPEKARSEAEGYEDTGQGVAAQDGPPVRTGGVHGWEPGQRVHFAGRDWDILAVSDNGLYIGLARGGVTFEQQYVNLNNVTVQPAKWAK